jgi:hypothetical protein
MHPRYHGGARIAPRRTWTDHVLGTGAVITLLLLLAWAATSAPVFVAAALATAFAFFATALARPGRQTLRALRRSGPHSCSPKANRIGGDPDDDRRCT